MRRAQGCRRRRLDVLNAREKGRGERKDKYVKTLRRACGRPAWAGRRAGEARNREEAESKETVTCD
jgi:hypothetical protein